MTWFYFAIIVIVYIVVLNWMSRKGWHLRSFVWAVAGQTYLVIQFALLIDLASSLAAIEAQNIQAITGLFNYDVQVFEKTTLLVPDDAGWVSMTIGIESSTLIEMAVLTGLLTYYPGFSRKYRIASLVIGIVGTYLLNLLRLLVIVLILAIWGRSSFVLAHAFVGRIIYFVGVVALYWYLLTTPTILSVKKSISERENE